MLPALASIALIAFHAGDSAAAWFDLNATVAAHPPSPGDDPVRGVAQSYSTDWHDGRADAEAARRWRDLPPLVELGLHARFDSLELRVDLPLHRDFDAWQQDPSGGNAPRGIEELDVNAPYEGWVRWHSESGRVGLQAGRFHQRFSWSQDHGVVLGSDVVHDGMHASARFGRWVFEVFGASLDPWLVGTDLQGDVDTGSEAWIQAYRTISNQKGRVFDEPAKSLFVHRLTVRVGAWDLAASEILIVGGKDPALRDVLPFVVWHDNFGDGFSKMSLGLQARWFAGAPGVVHAEAVIEEIRSPVGEEEGADRRTIYGLNLGWKKAPPPGRGGFDGTVDGTITSASLGNHELPLLKGVARRRYRSNNRPQGETTYIDQWVVDQPLGYHRGPDAADLWTRAGWVGRDSSWGTGFEVDWLNQGDAALWMDEVALANRWGPLSGDVTSEWRLLVDGWTRIGGHWTLRGQGGVVARLEPDEPLRVEPAASASIGWEL